METLEYVSLEEFNYLAPKLFTSAELEDYGWSDMDDATKEVLLGRAQSLIDTLSYKGQPWDRDKQLTKFPRRVRGMNTGIPVPLKYAVVETALRLTDTSIIDRINLQNLGVKSISFNSSSESYSDRLVFSFISEDIIRKYLRKYLVVI